MWISSREMSEQRRAWLASRSRITGMCDASGVSSVQLTSTPTGWRRFRYGWRSSPADRADVIEAVTRSSLAGAKTCSSTHRP
jgi:hypothetical protein